MTAAMLVLSIMAVAQEPISPAKCMTGSDMIVRLAEIEVYPQYLKEYLEFANEVDRLSVEREPGVVCLFPMQRNKLLILSFLCSPLFCLLVNRHSG